MAPAMMSGGTFFPARGQASGLGQGLIVGFILGHGLKHGHIPLLLGRPVPITAPLGHDGCARSWGNGLGIVGDHARAEILTEDL
jgi:hypothetical protein